MLSRRPTCPAPLRDPFLRAACVQGLIPCPPRSLLGSPRPLRARRSDPEPHHSRSGGVVSPPAAGLGRTCPSKTPPDRDGRKSVCAGICRYMQVCQVCACMCMYTHVCACMCLYVHVPERMLLIYTIISCSLSAWMAQWYIVSLVHLLTGVRAPETLKLFCYYLDVFLRVYFSAQRPQHQMPQLLCRAGNSDQILAHTCTYIHILTHTFCIHAHTYQYMQILPRIACICMYMHV